MEVSPAKNESTEIAIKNFQRSLNEHSGSLMQFMHGFSQLYGTQIENKQVIDLRDRTHRDCQIFTGVIIPPCRSALLAAKKYFDYFDSLSFSDFKTIATRVILEGNKCLELLQLSQELISSAHEAASIRKIEASTIKKAFEGKLKNVERRKKKIQDDIAFLEKSKKESIKTFSNVPLIGGLIAGIKAGNFNSHISKNYDKIEKEEDEIEKMGDVVAMIDDCLIPAILSYEHAIKGMILCFSFIKNQGKSVIDKMMDTDEEEDIAMAAIFFKQVGIHAKYTSDNLLSTIAFLELFDVQLQSLNSLDEADEDAKRTALKWINELESNKGKKSGYYMSLLDVITSKVNFKETFDKLLAVTNDEIKTVLTRKNKFRNKNK
jgi:hypothetical protein